MTLTELERAELSAGLATLRDAVLDVLHVRQMAAVIVRFGDRHPRFTAGLLRLPDPPGRLRRSNAVHFRIEVDTSEAEALLPWRSDRHPASSGRCRDEVQVSAESCPHLS